MSDVVVDFGETVALDGLNLQMKEGEVLGLLGPNGAGKTTAVNVLTTLLRPTSGTATVNGYDVVEQSHQVREQIGLAGQFAAVDETLSGRQNLEMVGRLYHLSKAESKSRAKDILQQITLIESADRPVRTYSGGMRRRLDLGASLMFTPKVLFLDEPTTGLDPKTRRDMWQAIRDMVDQGVTLMLTTQYLEEADELADRIMMIDEGALIAEGTSDELKRQLRGDILEIEIKDKSNLDNAAKLLTEAGSFSSEPEVDQALQTIRVAVEAGIKDLQVALKLMEDSNIQVQHVNLSQPSLDDVFLELTGKKPAKVEVEDD
jgi:ABC-2 type transport system ATP-binding protein